MDFNEWLEFGIKQGWCGPDVCYTHDGLPTTKKEDIEFEEGDDPCMHVIRLYEDSKHKEQVQDNHSPSIWRATNKGIKI